MTRTRVVVGAALVGLAIVTISLLFFTQEGTAGIVGYQHTGDAKVLVVVVAIGYCDALAERSVDEDATSVRITVRTRTTTLGNTCPSAITYLPVTVSLKNALGERRVFDQNGKALKDLGSYQVPTPPP